MPRHAIHPAIDLSLPVTELPRYLTLPEAAAYLRRSTRALARWEARGLIRFTRPAAGNPLIERSEIERLLTEGTR